MGNIFPDLSLALAHHPPQSEGGWSNQGILNETHDAIRRFLSLLKDHDAFSQSTIGVLVNRWGVYQPPTTEILPRIWVLNLCAHLSFLNCDTDTFQSGLTHYLTVARQNKTSFTEWIFRFLPIKKVIWIRRSKDIEKIKYGFLLKNYIAQIEIPAVEDIGVQTPVEDFKSLWGSEEWKDKSCFLWFPVKGAALEGQVLERLQLPNSYKDDGFGNFVKGLEEPPEAAHGQEIQGRQNRIESLRELLYYHNLIPYWTDIIYIPSSGNLDKRGRSEGSGGLILFERLPDNTPILTNHWFRWTLERVKFLHSASQQFYSYFIRQDRERISHHYALRSAIAAIMARNMDHLIGSHIETSAALQMSDLREEIHNLAHELYGNSLFKMGMTNPPAESKRFYADDFWEESFGEGTTAHGEKATRAFLDDTVRRLEREYSNYRIKRMDLIARFSTEWIPWGVGMSFYHQVMLPFMRNGLLLHFLGYGEGIRLRDIDIRVNYPVSDCVDCQAHTCPRHYAKIQYAAERQAPFYSLMIGVDQSRFSIQSEEPIQFSMPQSDLMKIRGGDIGAHAFHIILENILRNSAKHGHLAESPKILLSLWVIYDNPERTLDTIGFIPAPGRSESFINTVRQDNRASWFVVISSSADYPETSIDTALFDEMDQLLRRPLTAEASGPDPEAWGMKEKKICAAYLANVQPEETNSADPNYIYAGSVSSEVAEARRCLSYCVRIPRADFLLTID